MNIDSGTGLHACADAFDTTHAAFTEACIPYFLLQETYLLCHGGMIDSGQKRVGFDVDGFRVLGQYGADNGRPCSAQAGDARQFRQFFLTQNIGQPCLKGCKLGAWSFLPQCVFYF